MNERHWQPPQSGTGDFGAVKRDVPGIERIDIGENLDEGGLSSAIFPEKRESFAGAEVKADVVQGARAAELL